MSNDVYIVGIGMTPFGKLPGRTIKSLTAAAVGAALADAGCVVGDIEGAWFGNVGQGALEGQHAIRGQVALAAAGIGGIGIVNVEGACASSSIALGAARHALLAGAVDVALAVGCERMFVPEGERVRDLFDGCCDVHLDGRPFDALLGERQPASGDGDRSIFMDVYAAMTRDHMDRFGTTERQLAIVSAKNHFHSTFNPLAQYRRDMSVEEVLAARRIVGPLTLPMCSPIGDGAAAVVLCRGDQLGRFDRRRAVRVLASVVTSGAARTADQFEQHVTHRAARRAYDLAGIGPDDIAVAELHDATAFAEIVESENLMFCPFGEGGPLAESGATRLGGRLPINTSGGLESRGHPIGATGLAQVHELVLQLRGEAGARQVPGARFAIAENNGGFLGVEGAAACVTILGAPGH
jgi:acetyl-CoA acetyltransferase